MISTGSAHEKSKKKEGQRRQRGNLGQRPFGERSRSCFHREVGSGNCTQLLHEGSSTPSVPLFLAASCMLWHRAQGFHGHGVGK